MSFSFDEKIVVFLILSSAILLLPYFIILFREYESVKSPSYQQDCGKPNSYPHKDPILGLDYYVKTINALKNARLLQMDRENFESLGKTFQVNTWGVTTINTIDPHNIQTVLTLAFDSFGKEPVKQKHSGGNFMAKGIFTADGPLWVRSRALIRPTFARQQISDFGRLEAHFQHLLSRIPESTSYIDLQPLLKMFFLDTSTEFLFGESVGSLHPETSFDSQQFLESFDVSMRGLGARIQLGKFSFILGKDGVYNRAVANVHKYIDAHILRVLRELKSVGDVDETRSNENQKAQYILLKEIAKENQDPIDLRYQLLHVFFPAHEATGIAVSDLIFHLSRDHDRTKRLRREILAVGSPMPLSFETLKSLTFLRHCLNESLRLHPLAGIIRRVCHQDTVLPRGGGPRGIAPIYVRRGTTVSMNTHVLHRDKDLWGEDADEFRPERWETARPGWSYLPFSGGPRICPAQQMVYTEAAYLIVRLLQEFKQLECLNKHEAWTEQVRMVVENRNGVKVRLVRA